MVYMVVGDLLYQSSNKTTCRENLILTRIKWKDTLVLVLQQGLVESVDSSIHRENIETLLILTFL
jgi:hypothetical protein